MRFGSQQVVMVCDPKLTYRLLVEDRTFDKGGPLFDRIREVTGDNLVTCPHGQHRRLRRLCQPSFSAERLDGYATIMSEVARSTAAGWRDGQAIDVTRSMTAMVARASVRAMFATSLTSSALDRFLDELPVMLKGLTYRAIVPDFASRRADNADHGDLLYSLMSARDDTDTDDSESDGSDGSRALSEAELADETLAFLLAGTETTATLLAWALYLLAAHPAVEAAVHREVDSVLDGLPQRQSMRTRWRRPGG